MNLNYSPETIYKGKIINETNIEQISQKLYKSKMQDAFLFLKKNTVINRTIKKLAKKSKEEFIGCISLLIDYGFFSDVASICKRILEDRKYDQDYYESQFRQIFLREDCTLLDFINQYDPSKFKIQDIVKMLTGDAVLANAVQENDINKYLEQIIFSIRKFAVHRETVINEPETEDLEDVPFPGVEIVVYRNIQENICDKPSFEYDRMAIGILTDYSIATTATVSAALHIMAMCPHYNSYEKANKNNESFRFLILERLELAVVHFLKPINMFWHYWEQGVSKRKETIEYKDYFIKKDEYWKTIEECFAKWPNNGKAITDYYTRFKQNNEYNFIDLIATFSFCFEGKYDEAADLIIKKQRFWRMSSTEKFHLAEIAISCAEKIDDEDSIRSLYVYAKKIIRELRESGMVIQKNIEDMLSFQDKAEEFVDEVDSVDRFGDNISDDDPEAVEDLNHFFRNRVYGDGHIKSITSKFTKSNDGLYHFMPQDIDDLYIISSTFMCYSDGADFETDNMPLELFYMDLADSIIVWDSNAYPFELFEQQSFIRKYEKPFGYEHDLIMSEVLERIIWKCERRLIQIEENRLSERLSELDKIRHQLISEGQSEEVVLNEMSPLIEHLQKLIAVQDNEKYINKIREMEQRFLAEYHLDPSSSLINQSTQGQNLMSYLVTSERVFDFLVHASTGRHSTLDYSASLISLTKALEMVLNELYSKARRDYQSEWINSYNNLSDNEKRILQKYIYYDRHQNITIADRLELAPAIAMLMDKHGVFLDSNGELDPAMYNRPSIFYFLKLNELLDISRLRQFSGLEIMIQDTRRSENGRRGRTRFSGSDDDKNRLILMAGLDYIRLNYRNLVAHDASVTLQHATDCRHLMLQGEALLWILLYLINDEPISTV